MDNVDLPALALGPGPRPVGGPVKRRLKRLSAAAPSIWLSMADRMSFAASMEKGGRTAH